MYFWKEMQSGYEGWANRKKKNSHESFDVVTNRPVYTTCFQTAVER